MNKNEELEKNSSKMEKQKEKSDRNLLRLEIFIGFISSIIFLILILIASIVVQKWIKVLLSIFGLIIFTIGIYNCIKIEQRAGYYECQKCHYKYVPTYLNVLLAMHINRTRYMKCPKCNQRSWQKKVISK